VSYRDEDAARTARADALITEISGLEREKVARSELEHRLESARRELALLQATPAPPPAPPAPPGLAAHVLVFLAAAGATFAGYTLLF
jgi:hypothetical protein